MTGCRAMGLLAFLPLCLPSATLRGRIQDEFFAALAGSTATLRSEGAPYTVRRVQTDRDGGFVFEAIEAGEFRLEASAPGMMSLVIGHLQLGPDEVRLVPRLLLHAGEAAGNCTPLIQARHTRRASAAADVEVTGSMRVGREAGVIQLRLIVFAEKRRIEREGTTDSRGRFRFSVTTPGEVRLEIRKTEQVAGRSGAIRVDADVTSTMPGDRVTVSIRPKDVPVREGFCY